MITLTVGISNSGKTTWAEQQKAANINRDDIREELFSLSKYKFTKAKENKVTALQFERAAKAILAGIDVIISDTNLNPKTREKWRVFASDNGIELEIKEFPIEPHVAKARNIKREYSIPPSAIDRQYVAWRKYKGMPQYLGTPGKPAAIIFDVDGTLADMTGIRNPFEWDKVRLDMPRENVINLARALHKNGYKIIVMSGRDGICKEDTALWLRDYSVPYDTLIQRAPFDSRADAIIKEELFWKDVADNYDVKFVVDDRDQVVQRWRAMGLECWQVQDGSF